LLTRAASGRCRHTSQEVDRFHSRFAITGRGLSNPAYTNRCLFTHVWIGVRDNSLQSLERRRVLIAADRLCRAVPHLGNRIYQQPGQRREERRIVLGVGKAQSIDGRGARIWVRVGKRSQER
jgi:hypothetical protein